MAQIVSKSFTAVGVSDAVLIPAGDSLYYTVSGTFVGTVVLEKSNNGGLAWVDAGVSASAAAATLFYPTSNVAGEKALYRWRCSAFTSGTIVATLLSNQQGTRHIHPCGIVAKVGATSGWVVGAASNICLATLPASQTSSTLVVPLRGLKLGDVIRGFHLIGQVESVGGTVTIACNLRKHTAAAADVVDASVASMASLSVTAQTTLSRFNTSSPDFPCVVGGGETYYFLITGTTAASTDIALQGLAVFIDDVEINKIQQN